jgi:hypothetical protein
MRSKFLSGHASVNETISSEQTDSETDEVNTIELEAILPKRLNQSTESHQSWSDDHVSISSNDYQTSSKINKTETSKSSEDLEKDHGSASITS